MAVVVDGKRARRGDFEHVVEIETKCWMENAK